MRLGVTTLEMDVSLTAADVRVVSHDTRLNPAHTRDAQGAWLSGAGPAIRSLTAPLKAGDFASVPLMVRTAAGDGGSVIWSPNYLDLTGALVREAHGLGLRVIPWTVNQTADMARLIDWQVDGLITDYPDQLRALMRERSMPLPPRAEP